MFVWICVLDVSTISEIQGILKWCLHLSNFTISVAELFLFTKLSVRLSSS